MKGQVIRSSQREFDCRLDSGELVKAWAKAEVLKSNDIVVGDIVALRQENSDWIITDIHPRMNEIFRINIRESKKKVTAANCDRLVIVSSVSRPPYKRGIIDRFLVRAYQWNIIPLVVFNKMDEYDSQIFSIEFEIRRLASLNVECFEISATNENYQPQIGKSFKDLQDTLHGKTSIFLGQSGVGKSQSIQALSGGTVILRTHEVGRVGKGSHTTTWSEIVEGPEMRVIDSPGIRSFSLDDIDPDDLLHYFPDVQTVATQCRFRDCQHTQNSLGCAFENATEDLLGRLESYQKIHEEISQTPFWQKSRKYLKK